MIKPGKHLWRLQIALFAVCLFAMPAHAHKVEGEPPRIVSPAMGAEVGDVRIPLHIWIPREWSDRTITVTLDGTDITDPLAIVRNRGLRNGGGADYLSVMSLEGLAPGIHLLEARFSGADSDVDLVRGEFSFAPHGAGVRFRITDAQGVLRPGRVLVFDAAGKTVNLRGPNFRESEGTHRDKRGFTAFAPKGEGYFRVPPGAYTLVFAGGLRDEVRVVEANLRENEHFEIVLPRVLKLPDWVTADLHVHTGRSGDSYLPDAFRLESLISAGLDVVVLSDHNHITDARPALAQLDVEGLHLIHGVEARLAEPRPPEATDRRVSRAHMNMFPVNPVGEQPDQEAPNVVAFLDSWRARQRAHPHAVLGDRLLIQLNHPRGIQIKPKWQVSRKYALFVAADFSADKAIADHDVDWLVPDDWASQDPHTRTHPLDVDLLELMNRASATVYDEVRTDWFSLMNRGRFLTATGNSDSHTIHAEQAGFPLNLVRVAAPAQGDAFDEAGFVDALARGAVSVSNGPVVDLRVGTLWQRAESGGTLRVKQKKVTVQVTVQAAPWVPVHEVRLIHNGVVVERVALREPLPADGRVERGKWSWRVSVQEGDWLIAEAGWPESDPAGRPTGVYERIAPGHRPIGFTNPVRLIGETP